MAEGGVTSNPANESTGEKLTGCENVSKKNADGNTPLHIAAMKGNNDVIKMLLKLGVSAKARNNRGETALHMAVESGCEEAIRSLVEAGADLLSETDDGRTVWHLAASAGNSTILKMLAEYSVSEKNQEEKYELEHEISNGISEVGNPIPINASENVSHSILISSDDCSNDTHKTLEVGCEDKCPPEIDSIKRDEVGSNVIRDANIGEKSISQPREINLKGKKSKKCKKTQLKQDESIGRKEIPPKAPSTECVLPLQNSSPEEFMWSSRESIDSDYEEDEESHFRRAAFEIHPLLILHRLLFSGPSETFRGKEEARIHFNNICTRNVDLKKKDHNGFTALHMAAGCGAEEAVFRFLKKKPDVNAKAHNGTTPIMMAASDGSVKVIKMLIKAGANYKVKNPEGVTPLHIAAANRNTSAVNFFLSLGLDPNSKDVDGNTPLHFAAHSRGNFGVVTALLKAKANANLHNANGLTPASMAAIRGNFELVHVFNMYRM